MATVLRITDHGSDAAEFEQVDPKRFDHGTIATITVSAVADNVHLTRTDLAHLRDWAVAVLADVDARAAADANPAD